MHFKLAFRRKLNHSKLLLFTIITAAADNYNENQLNGVRCQSIRLLHQSQYFLEIQLRGGEGRVSTHVICVMIAVEDES